MTDFQTTAPRRRTGPSLLIEGTATVVSRSSQRVEAGAPVCAPSMLDLAQRLSSQPYQSLLDDAMRLARCCRPLTAATLRVLSPSS